MNTLEKFSLKNKVAIVTGGAGRLGPSFSEAFMEAGCKVVLADFDKKKGEEVVSRLEKKFKSQIVFHQTDVTDKKSVDSLISFTLKKFKQIDILVNGAMAVGENFYKPFESTSWEDWTQVMEVNVGGTFLCSQAAGEVMKEQKSGSIINIGSIYGVGGADKRIYGTSGINSPAVYAASKGAVINLTRYLAVYWADSGIRANTISPGGVFDDQKEDFVAQYSQRTPMGRMLKRDELKGALLFLASDASSYVTGHNLMVDGGWTAW